MQDSTSKLFIISLGSNLGYSEAEDNLLKAEFFLRSLLGPEIQFSSHYQTDGVGSGFGKKYLNSVCIGYTDLTFLQIKSELKQFELDCGRSLETRNRGIVPIDLDLLQLGDEVYKQKDLKKDFVTRGLKEIK